MRILLILSLITLVGATAQARKKVVRQPASESDVLQKILIAENHRVPKTPYLIADLHSGSPAVVKAAMMALGRIGDNSGLTEMSRLLNSRQNEMRKVAAFSMGIMHDPVAHKLIAQHIQMQRDPEVLFVLYKALGRYEDPKDASVFYSGLETQKNSRALEGAAIGLQMLWSNNPSMEPPSDAVQKKLVVLAEKDDTLAVAALGALSFAPGDDGISSPALEASVIRMRSEWARALAVRVLGKRSSPTVDKLIVQLLRNDVSPSVRREAAAVMYNRSWSPEVAAALQSALKDTSNMVVSAALDSLTKYGEAAVSLAPEVHTLFKRSSSNWLRSQTLKALLTIQPAVGNQELTNIVQSKEHGLLRLSIGLLPKSNLADVDARLRAFALDPRTDISTAALLAIQQLDESTISAEMKSALRTVWTANDPGHLAILAEIATEADWKEMVPLMAGTLPTLSSTDYFRAKLNIIAGLEKLGDHSCIDELEAVIRDRDPEIAQAAARAYRKIAGKDSSVKPAKFPSLNDSTPALATALEASRKKFLVTTNRGTLTVALFAEAPLTALNFSSLSKKGFYDGKLFHHVEWEPSSLVQGGDPRADGFGGPGYFIRDEVSMLPQKPGTLAMATQGRDTGGSQFVINLFPNYQLEGKTTVFGEITDGFDVALRLEPGDRIISIRETSGKGARRSVKGRRPT